MTKNLNKIWQDGNMVTATGRKEKQKTDPSAYRANRAAFADHDKRHLDR